MKWTQEDLDKKLKAGTLRGYIIGEKKEQEKKENKSKYGNKWVEFDGIKFQSKREANRYYDLMMLYLGGYIKMFRMQVEFELNDGGKFSHKYVADFVYLDLRNNEFVIEDCKGFRTNVYRKKQRLMKKIYGIEIKET